MRYDKIDIFRWIAIILMVLFHINYSLVYIFQIYILDFSSVFWFIIWKTRVLLFIILSSFSFFLAQNKYQDKVIKKYLKYSFLLFFISISISLFTYFFMKNQLILFGILHFFSLSFLLILLLRKFYKFNLLLSFVIILFPFFFDTVIKNHYLFPFGFTYPWFYSADYYPLIPYFWVFLLWYSSVKYLYIKWIFQEFFILKKETKVNSFLKYIWKKSLIIYLIHQPIIISIIYIFKKVF